MLTPVPSLIDHSTASFALTDPRAVNPSFMDSTTVAEDMIGLVVSVTFTTNDSVDSFDLLSTALIVKL